ncbi:zinc finger BED domain-containing protein 4-like isoform X1 [Oryzias latipes]|uniref:zinc finger BED domain-containing protein 4-like isoform X1 n=2 Tax=Oryzias latipes TaxID=8090 RepID=UPI000CE19F57|nr:zinc finger BED domain-containing protein 4-like isoform X1 [Oryzias latipes]
MRRFRVRGSASTINIFFFSSYVYFAVSRKQELDSALVDMIVMDAQPFSIVEDKGFKAFVNLLDPSYIIPNRKALRTMVEEKYKAKKEKALDVVSRASAVSLTADMWTSINMDAYLAVTCHFITEEVELASVVLGVLKFPQTHTAAHLAEAKNLLMEEWGIKGKVTGLVTDCAPNMVACANILLLRHIMCFAHMLNLVVKKSLAQTPELEDIRSKGRRIVGLFKSSTTAKEKLSEMQRQLARPEHKLIQEVETRWNSTFNMLERLFKEREPLGAALATLHTDLPPLTSEDYQAIHHCLSILSPFQEARVEFSTEKRVSASKVIPMVKMLKHYISSRCGQITHPLGEKLATNLKNNLHERFSALEKVTALSMATLSDPRFKELGFCSQGSAHTAIERLTKECAATMQALLPEAQPQSPPREGPSSQQEDGGLWALLDRHVGVQQQVTSTTASATVEVQRYLKEPHIPRTQDPLRYWVTHKVLYPHLYKLAMKFLCTPASSVPCERIFSKAGEIVSQRRNRLKPSTVEKILFLNKNL